MLIDNSIVFTFSLHSTLHNLEHNYDQNRYYNSKVILGYTNWKTSNYERIVPDKISQNYDTKLTNSLNIYEEIHSNWQRTVYSIYLSQNDNSTCPTSFISLADQHVRFASCGVILIYHTIRSFSQVISIQGDVLAQAVEYGAKHTSYFQTYIDFSYLSEKCNRTDGNNLLNLYFLKTRTDTVQFQYKEFHSMKRVTIPSIEVLIKWSTKYQRMSDIRNGCDLQLRFKTGYFISDEKRRNMECNKGRGQVIGSKCYSHFTAYNITWAQAEEWCRSVR